MASLLASGAMMRAATIAAARSRSREALPSISFSKPSRRMAMRTASTCPCGSERMQSRPPPAGASFSPLSTSRIASACSSVSADRLAMVRFLMRWPSRMLSRSRIAGLEVRLGTKSMYMPRNVADLRRCGLSHADALHGYIMAPRMAYRLEMSDISPFRHQNFGLDPNQMPALFAIPDCISG